ncbi:3'-5' exonuclease [Geodermatophilus chilensis]|uniref:3'-5' exonuclease n=1 Tax=Geodermatophilus chilensis TaxID=2035835 RepID=UPI0018E4BEC7|nr:3'-5' exonuclease [Geodermatophilus chilensis]
MSAAELLPATPGAALAALWARLRLVVVDVETLVDPDRRHRLIEVAVVTCRAGGVKSSWSARANPGHPVDDHTRLIHGITTDALADEPEFAAIEPELTRRLRGIDGEHVVLVAHNARTDVGVLRHEYKLLGVELPELAVLDTMALPRALGVRPTGKGLDHLVRELALTNPKAHSAPGDARATAEAVIALLERAAEQGWNDFEALRTHAMGRRAGTTTTIRGRGRQRLADDADEFADEPELPEEHTEAHGLVLTSTDPTDVADWQAALAECAHLRCPYVADRVAVADVPASIVLAAVEAELSALLAPPVDGDTGGAWWPDVPAVATLVGTLEPLLAALPDRRAALAWHDAWLPRLGRLGRCDRDDRDGTPCPSCRRGEPCPLDLWQRFLAPAALGAPANGGVKGVVKSFLHTTGKDTGRGVLSTWLKDGRRLLAEATAWVVHARHRAAGQDVSAQSFARLAWKAGCREPRLAAAYANLLATPGDEAALRRAVEICDEALLSRGGSTFDGWTELGAKRAQLLGRLERRRVRHSGELDEDGNPIPARRHHPGAPQRSRPRRFAL